MKDVALLSVLGFVALALITLAPRRYTGLPLTERLVYSILRLAAWLEHIGTAADAALVRYRLERQLLMIRLESTTERTARTERKAA